jgi:hypothetical protein
MTDEETMGEVIDEDGTPPPGFNLEAEASRPDAVTTAGIVERPVEPEPEDDELPEIINRGRIPGPDAVDLEPIEESGDAEDDDVIDDPGNAAPLEDI